MKDIEKWNQKVDADDFTEDEKQIFEQMGL